MAGFYERAYVSLIRRAVFPLHERLKGHSTTRMLREMENDQWMDVAQLRQLQNQRLRQLLKHAFTTVKYYRELVRDLGLSADDFQSEADLEKLPLLDKKIIRSNIDNLKSSDAKGIQPFSTGGS